jgi:hypothetical protein
MEFHRNIWHVVLKEVHTRRPNMIGVAPSGLQRPMEPRPDGEALTYAYDTALLKRYKEAFAKHRKLRQTDKPLQEKLMQKYGTLSYLPSAFEFVAYTKHVVPPRTKQVFEFDASHNTQSLTLDNQHLTDADIQKTHRTHTGYRNIFSYASVLDLSTNDLVNPMFGQEMTALTDLNLSRNRITGLEGVKGLWTQLVALNLMGNEIEVFPFTHSANLPMLRLDASSNLLTVLTPIAQFTNLQELNVTGNTVRTLMHLNPLTQLTRLVALNCKLEGPWDTVIPPLPVLKMLFVDNNHHLFFSTQHFQRVSSSTDAATNNRKFTEKFPSLEVLRAEAKELKAEKEVRNAVGEIVSRGKSIILSDLRRLAP